MKTIGGSIQEAIDWTQDHLGTTRPLAESTLFSMLAAKSVTQTDVGFVLLEEEDNDMDEHFKKHVHQVRFHYNARRGRIHRMASRNHMQSDAAESMMAVDKGHKTATKETSEISAKGKQAIARAALKMGISYAMLEAICSDKPELK